MILRFERRAARWTLLRFDIHCCCQLLLCCWTLQLATTIGSAAGIPLSPEAGLQHVRLDENSNFSTQYVQQIMRHAKAAEMLNYMNESADPCTNFYAFACGNWAKINPANGLERLSTGLFESMSKALDRKVSQLLEEEFSAEDTEVDRKVKDFYASCLSVRSSSSEYREQLFGIIAEFGEMPLLKGDAWNESAFDWIETVGRISHDYGEDIIIGLDIMADYNDNSVNRIYIGHPELPLESRSMYLDSANEIYRNAYRCQVADQLENFFGIWQKEMVTAAAADIVDFEIELAKGIIDDKLNLGLDEMSKLTTVNAMHAKYAPTLDIKKLINATLREPVTDFVYEFVEQYQLNLKALIERTPKRSVANYIFYRLVQSFLINESSSSSKMEKKCIEKTRKFFAKNLDNMIFRRFNTRETQQDVELIWQELKLTFASLWSSDKLNWIADDTREKALQKLQAMNLSINSYENENLIEQLENVSISRDNYVQNIQNYARATSYAALQALHMPPEPIEAAELLSYTPANIILENIIKIPVSLLQPYHLWASNYPNALKFGTLGSLIGHEIMHGFDDNGRKFDKQGNNKDWWDEASTKHFITKTSCFEEQYSKYLYGGKNLPKSSSQSENIADNGGVRLAYAAYSKWLAEAESSKQSMQLETLPNMKYSNKKLFFISYAQVWCNDVSPRLRNLQVATDDHVPGKFRVIGPLSNFPAFAEEFECKLGSKMNPPKKCEIY